MKKSGWIKFFIDNTEEWGADEDVARGRASWSRGRLDGIKEVTLYTKDGKNFTLSHNGFDATEFWQSDDYEAVVGQKPRIICRRLQVKRDNGKWYTIELDPKTLEILKDYEADNKI